MTGILLYELVLAAITIIGAVAVWFWNSPYDKLIGVAIVFAGAVPFIVVAGFLDVAVAVSLIMPIGTIFVLRLREVEDID